MSVFLISLACCCRCRYFCWRGWNDDAVLRVCTRQAEKLNIRGTWPSAVDTADTVCDNCNSSSCCRVSLIACIRRSAMHRAASLSTGHRRERSILRELCSRSRRVEATDTDGWVTGTTEREAINRVARRPYINNIAAGRRTSLSSDYVDFLSSHLLLL